MIKSYKFVIPLIFISLIILASTDDSIKINKVQRQIALNSNFPLQQIKISFTALENQVSSFQHGIPIQYDNNLNKIAFMKSKDNKHQLQFTRSQYIFNGKKYAIYKVDLERSYFENEEGQINVVAIYLNRYVNFPEAISMSEDQKFEFQDAKYFISPYQVVEQQNIYKFDKLLNYDKTGQVKGLNTVTYRNKNAKPFQFQRHVVHGINNDPQVLFSQVQRIIQVSHWGNIAITQFYKIKNIGPSLKGEFSRVQFGSQSQAQAKNAFRGIEAELPLNVWGLYYRDQVGNISTSKAYRDQYAKKVVLALAPRYGLLGGWKANWQIGYNLNSKGYLYNDGNKFQLDNINLEYTLQKVLAENYSFKIILPEGAVNVKVKIGDVQLQPTKVSGSYGYLDFIGRPTFEFANYKGVLKTKKITVDYDLDTISGLQKPILMFVVIFSLLAISIIFKRLRLDAFQGKKQE